MEEKGRIRGEWRRYKLLATLGVMWLAEGIANGAGMPVFTLEKEVTPRHDHRIALPAVDGSEPALFKVTIKAARDWRLVRLDMTEGAGWEPAYQYMYLGTSPDMAYSHATFQGELARTNAPPGSGRGSDTNRTFTVKTEGSPITPEYRIVPEQLFVYVGQSGTFTAQKRLDAASGWIDQISNWWLDGSGHPPSAAFKSFTTNVAGTYAITARNSPTESLSAAAELIFVQVDLPPLSHVCTTAVHSCTHDTVVTVMPSSPATNITLELKPVSGTGSAVFTSNNSSTRSITGTTSVSIRGTGASSAVSNMVLEVRLGSFVCTQAVFTVVDTVKLTAADAANAANTIDDITQTDDLRSLNLFQGTNGTAAMVHDLTWRPAAYPATALRWEIIPSGSSSGVSEWGTSTSGTYASRPVTSTWDVASATGAVTNRQFKLRSWFDCNTNGLYDADEPHRIIEVGIIKVESVEWETYSGNTTLDTCPNNGGKRIFPGKKDPTDTEPSLRRRVQAKAKITPALEGIQIYFRIFDPDDPSTNDAPIDPNGWAGGDNRVTGWAMIGGWPSTTDASGEATAVLSLSSRQPGDNFIMLADCRADRLSSVTQAQVDLNSFNPIIVSSEMLTIWRRLWLEFDSMGPAPSSGDEKNFDEGSIIAIQPNVPVVGQSTLALSIKLADNANRYEGGYIDIASVGVFTVISNTDRLLSNDEVVIEGAPGLAVVGKTFEIWDDDVVLLGVSRPPRTLPYTLSGGDLLDSAFADAYIKPTPVDAGYIDTDVPFNRNVGLLEWSSVVDASRNLTHSEELWTAYLLAAWQGPVGEDDDPPDAFAVGIYGEASDWNNRGTIYIETLRESERLPTHPRIHEEHTVVHEIGHQGGGSHSDGGIMTSGAPITENKFSAETLIKFRGGVTF
jgi:hypothetical protein